jgi:hypothetical protein
LGVSEFVGLRVLDHVFLKAVLAGVDGGEVGLLSRPGREGPEKAVEFRPVRAVEEGVSPDHPGVPIDARTS